MCSIPGLPTPGSKVPVLITRVNLNPSCGLLELWVNMDDGKKHIYEQLREVIQVPERKFNGLEGKPGDLCLVCISDEWHRARIVLIQREIYSVFLIDQGQPHFTTSESLAWGKSDYFLLPPEIETCILANILSLVKNWPDKASNFLKSLPGKKFEGLVHHVLMPDRVILLDIPVVSKHMCKYGVTKKIPIDEFKCLAMKCLHLPKGDDSKSPHITQEQNMRVGCQLEKQDQYFCPELLTDTFETVIVTEATDPHNIFCKLLIFSKAVKILSEHLHQHYEENPDSGGTQPRSCGDPCAARGLNGRWNRSQLKQDMTSGGAVEVLHVDKGTTELVPVGDIKPLDVKFLRMPVVTYHCRLSDIEDKGTGWTTDQIDYLKSQLQDQTVEARFDSHDISQGIYNVTLYTANAACTNFYFIEKTGAALTNKNEAHSNGQNEVADSSGSSLEDKQCVDVQNKVQVNDESVEEDTGPSNVNLAVNGTTDGIPTPGTDDTQIRDGSELPNLAQSNGPLMPGFLSELQNACDQDAFAVGSCVSVKVSCIESLRSFWCQTAEDGDSLRLLMQHLQNHYASTYPQPLVESVCVARNPSNGMWYRARIIADDNSPIVDVRFIDYGQTLKVPLRDVRPIDPAFLRLNAQAVQCCLADLKNPSNPIAVAQTEVALTEFRKLVDLVSAKCIVKNIISDEEGLPINVVDIETASAESVCTQLTAQAHAHAHIPQQVKSDVYTSSTYGMETGRKEKVFVTFVEDVNLFYCHLARNSQLSEKVMENVGKFIHHQQSTDLQLELNSMCLAKYTDNNWYRGQVVEISPKLKVKFVDYGQTLVLNESDVCPFPSEAGIAMSAPVQAVPLGLFNVPGDVPQEVNQWFADGATEHYFTISVVAIEATGKLIVELSDGCVSVNEEVRKRISQATRQKDRPEKSDFNKTYTPNNSVNMDVEVQEATNVSVEVRSSDAIFVPEYSSSFACGEILDEERKPLDVILEDKETELTETFNQGGCSSSEGAQLSAHSCPKRNENVAVYKRPDILPNHTVDVYASCIGGPHFFWCQAVNTEDLDSVSALAQEVGQEQLKVQFSKTLDPGSPCLALFPSDNQWYRAQVLTSTENTVQVMFIDYGNESEVDLKDVRPLPRSLLDMPPQAFLCSLHGFDESKGSWTDEAYDDFYSILVDKSLHLTVVNVGDHSEIAVPQFAVEIECEGVVVNTTMKKYWKPAAKKRILTDSPKTEKSLQEGQMKSNLTCASIPKGNADTVIYKKPNVSRIERVYASCISEPHFFWCQYANTEELNELSRLAQEAGQAQQDLVFSRTLVSGNPCLALFSSDSQWYRAQVINRVNNTFHVMFIDYGNESDVDIKDVRPLPQSLLDKPPQAFLCSLNGFDASKGCWKDEVYDDFHSLLVDKPLTVTVFNVQNHPEIDVLQYLVQIECEGEVVNALMDKYWTELGTNLGSK
ncbi:uncharacterized protein V6R79_023280 [Siganus canaliculatus]